MKLKIGSVIIESYQTEDFINTLLMNGYTVEIKSTKNKHLITIYKIEEM